MKKRLLSFIFILFISFLYSNKLKSQVVDYDDPDRNVFWFEVNVRTIIDKETYFEKYTVIRMGKRVYRGSIDEFDEILWAGMSAGSKIAIGPFSVYEDAYEAMLMFDLKDTAQIENTTEKYWFLVNIKITERLKSYEFDHMAAAIAAGQKTEFKDILQESLAFKTLAIGPFTNQLDAEESKRRYRLEE
jgi:hypothetical protein